MEECEACSQVAVGKSDTKTQTLWIEGRVRDGISCKSKAEFESRIATELSGCHSAVELWDDVLSDQQKARDALRGLYEKTIETLTTLKVVEYVGPKRVVSSIRFSECLLKVQIYEMYDDARSLDDNQELPQAEITSLPHLRFEGKWDELIFDHDLKRKLVRMMWNISRLSAKGENSMNPLVLVHGPPGTGKTTLCQALAQKISIRLSSQYQETKLIEIKSASLLSKYFGQSAKQVDEIFTKIYQMCNEDEERFVCVLIDEVESIAASRERTAMHGEAQDSLRATNALLTGIDRLKEYKNVMLLCTSNFVGSLDVAFLDRCAVKQGIEIPTKRAQYTILRGKIQSLIDKNIIQSDVLLPSYDGVNFSDKKEGPDNSGRQLVEILDQLRTMHSQAQTSWKMSGRSLAQLPHTAILLFLEEEECSLEKAFGFINKYIMDEQQPKPSSAEEDGEVTMEPLAEENSHALEIRGKKRKLTVLMEEDCDEAAIGELIKHLLRRDEGSTPETFVDEDDLYEITLLNDHEENAIAI